MEEKVLGVVFLGQEWVRRRGSYMQYHSKGGAEAEAKVSNPVSLK